MYDFNWKRKHKRTPPPDSKAGPSWVRASEALRGCTELFDSCVEKASSGDRVEPRLNAVLDLTPADYTGGRRAARDPTTYVGFNVFALDCIAILGQDFQSERELRRHVRDKNLLLFDPGLSAELGRAALPAEIKQDEEDLAAKEAEGADGQGTKSKEDVKAELDGLTTLKKLKTRAVKAGVDAAALDKVVNEAQDDPKPAVRELILEAEMSTAAASGAAGDSIAAFVEGLGAPPADAKALAETLQGKGVATPAALLAKAPTEEQLQALGVPQHSGDARPAACKRLLFSLGWPCSHRSVLSQGGVLGAAQGAEGEGHGAGVGRGEQEKRQRARPGRAAQAPHHGQAAVHLAGGRGCRRGVRRGLAPAERGEGRDGCGADTMADARDQRSQGLCPRTGPPASARGQRREVKRTRSFSCCSQENL